MPAACAAMSRPRCPQPPSTLNGPLGLAATVPNTLLSRPQSPARSQHVCLLFPYVPPDTPHPLPPGPGVSVYPDLVAVHPVAVPQGEDLPQGDGNGKTNHSDGEGISHQAGEQLGVGGRWGHQPVRGICETKGGSRPWSPSPPCLGGARAHPAGMSPTTSTPNLDFRPTP